MGWFDQYNGEMPHPGERPLGRVSMDELNVGPSFETRAKSALLRKRKS